MDKLIEGFQSALPPHDAAGHYGVGDVKEVFSPFNAGKALAAAAKQGGSRYRGGLEHNSFGACVRRQVDRWNYRIVATYDPKTDDTRVFADVVRNWAP